MPYADPPRSRPGQMLDELIELLEADDDLQPVFDFGGDNRIMKDDPGSLKKGQTRLLIMTPIGERDDDASFDDPSATVRGTDEYRLSIGTCVYVYKDKASTGEMEKDLCVDLTGLARDCIRKYLTSPTLLWFDIEHRGTEYDTGDYFRRSNSLFVVRGRHRRF